MESTQSSQARKQGGAKAEEYQIQPIDDVLNYVRAYAKEKPEMAALWIFGAGFVLGWKLKPW